MNKSRRTFINKMAYAIPTVMVLGTLTTSAQAKGSALHVDHGKGNDNRTKVDNRNGAKNPK